MIKLKIKQPLLCDVVCVVENSYDASKLLKMLACIPEDKMYSVESIDIETETYLIGKEYKVHDNSYCINTANGSSARLVQVDESKSEFKYFFSLNNNFTYSPDEDERGARFIIVKEPYICTVVNTVLGGKYHIIVTNVVSTNTGKIYRVLFDDRWVLYCQ